MREPPRFGKLGPLPRNPLPETQWGQALNNYGSVLGPGYRVGSSRTVFVDSSSLSVGLEWSDYFQWVKTIP